jgi:gamma-glutamylcyclotransferase (GGCT)/AIG2-like uncharacterized protein YtfP
LLDRLFVYGTLRAGGGQEWRLRGAASMGKSRMAGRLYRLGNYPGMVRDGADFVIGEVYRLVHAERLLAELDLYEGDRYTRVSEIAVLADGTEVECWVYVYRGAVEESQRIASGDFLR